VDFFSAFVDVFSVDVFSVDVISVDFFSVDVFSGYPANRSHPTIGRIRRASGFVHNMERSDLLTSGS
jgi:hypothetical protein